MTALFSKKLLINMAMLISTAIFFSGCQKELTGTVFTFGCKVQQWADLDSAGNATQTFDFRYDTATGKPALLQYNDITSGNTQSVIPVFAKDTVYFNVGSYAVLDNSKRIYRLEEQNSVNTAVPDGSYFYTYDASGHIATRIYDDGVASETTTYTFTGDELTKTNESLLGTANAVTTTYSYSATTKIKDYNPFIFAAKFPELRLYMPCFSFGRFTDKAIEKTVVKINIPFIPVPEITNTFSAYQLDAKGNILKVQIDGSIAGVRISKDFFSGKYLCR